MRSITRQKMGPTKNLGSEQTSAGTDRIVDDDRLPRTIKLWGGIQEWIPFCLDLATEDARVIAQDEHNY